MLIVKLLGKKIGFLTMRDRLKAIWRLIGGFELMDIGNGFYMVKCDKEEDHKKIMEGGPWMIFDHFLAVQTWSPEFASPTSQIEKTFVWIRFPSVNMMYYNESVIMALANRVGRHIRVDFNTQHYTRGKFARVCMEVDLTQPVLGVVGLCGSSYKVEYKGLHIIYSRCWRYGHYTRDCQYKSLNLEMNQNASSIQGEGGAANSAKDHGRT